MGKVEITEDKIICYVNNDILRRKYKKTIYDIMFYGVDSFEPSLLHTYSMDLPVYYVIENMKFDYDLKIMARNNTCVIFKNCVFQKSIKISWADKVIFENNKYYNRYPSYYSGKYFFTAHLKSLKFVDDNFINSDFDHHPTNFGMGVDVRELEIENSQFKIDGHNEDIYICSKKTNIIDSMFDCSQIYLQSDDLNICDCEIVAREGIIIDNKNCNPVNNIIAPIVVYNGVEFLTDDFDSVNIGKEIVELNESRKLLLDQLKSIRDYCNCLNSEKINEFKNELNNQSVQKTIQK